MGARADGYTCPMTDHDRHQDAPPAADRPDPEVMTEQIRQMDEGQSAGPDAPETIEPVHGRTDGARRADLGTARSEEWGVRTSEQDAHASSSQVVARTAWLGAITAIRPLRRAWRRLRGRDEA